mmetsp:Transcript_10684/g.16041  ORF Transcript_10684/g.16041 Transcript_10684/m.16041 type:complete len:228 (+) Transcript_10684:978-1661(+)
MQRMHGVRRFQIERAWRVIFGVILNGAIATRVHRHLWHHVVGQTHRMAVAQMQTILFRRRRRGLVGWLCCAADTITVQTLAGSKFVVRVVRFKFTCAQHKPTFLERSVDFTTFAEYRRIHLFRSIQLPQRFLVAWISDITAVIFVGQCTLSTAHHTRWCVVTATIAQWCVNRVSRWCVHHLWQRLRRTHHASVDGIGRRWRRNVQLTQIQRRRYCLRRVMTRSLVPA